MDHILLPMKKQVFEKLKNIKIDPKEAGKIIKSKTCVWENNLHCVA